MKTIFLTTYFCILLRGTLQASSDTNIESLVPTIPAGYTEYHGKYYKLYTEKRTWQDARKACILDDSELATVNSADEARFLQSLLLGKSFGYPGAWIGFRDFGSRNWKTIKSETLESTGYNTWWPGSNKHVGDCGTIKTCSRYDARDCSTKLMYICEYTI